MKKSTAELLMGIKAAARHGDTCGINQTAISSAIADGVPITVVDRKRVTTGNKTHIECIVSCVIAEEFLAKAEKTLQDLAAEESARLEKEAAAEAEQMIKEAAAAESAAEAAAGSSQIPGQTAPGVSLPGTESAPV